MALTLGDPVPDFTLSGWVDGAEQSFSLSERRGHAVVLAFYPADSSAVCTKQMCNYSNELDTFTALDATVWGISTQDLDSKERFAAQRSLKLPLLADTDHSVARAYGVDSRLGTKRAVFIVAPDGTLAYGHVATFGLTYKNTETLAEILRGLDRGSATVEP